MYADEPTNPIQLSGVEAVVSSQLDGIEPELASLVVSLDVHVRWLVAVEACEEHAIRSGDSLDTWHPGRPTFLLVRSATVSRVSRGVAEAAERTVERRRHSDTRSRATWNAARSNGLFDGSARIGARAGTRTVTPGCLLVAGPRDTCPSSREGRSWSRACAAACGSAADGATPPPRCAPPRGLPSPRAPR